MSGRQYPLVLVPRYTTYAGAGEFTTMPLNVSRFVEVFLHLWRAALVGTAPSIQFHFEESSDQDRWIELTALDPGAVTEVTVPLPITRPLLRVRVEILGVDSVATCYVHGYLLEPS